MATSHSHQVAFVADQPSPRVAAEPAPARPKLVVVPDAVKRRRRAGLLASVLFGLVFTAMVGMVAFQAQLAANQLELDRMESEIRQAQAEFDRNRLQLALLQSPQTVLRRATELGMVDAGRTTYAAPRADAVTEVLKSVGPQAAGSTSETRADWSEYKRVMGTSP